MNPSSHDSLVEDVMQALYEIANRDGKITPEEHTLLEQIRRNLKEYQFALKKALQDGTIDENEQKKLLSLKRKVIRSAKGQMAWDNYISEDEEAILEAIVQKLQELL